jgi:WD40 repeat protein
MVLAGVLCGWSQTNRPIATADRSAGLAPLEAEIVKTRARLAELVTPPTTWQEVASWQIPRIEHLAVSAAGASVVTLGEFAEEGVHIFEAGRSKPRVVLRGKPCERLCISPDGKRALVESSSEVFMLRLPDGAIVAGPIDPTLLRPPYHWLPDSQTVLGTKSWSMAWWRPSGKPKHAEHEHGQGIVAFAVRSNGSQIASLCTYGHVKRYTPDGQELGDTEIQGKRGADLCYVAGGRLLAVSGQEDWAIHLLDAERGTIVAALRAHEAPVFNVVPVGEGARLVSMDRNAEIRLWDVVQPACIDVRRCYMGWNHPSAPPIRKQEDSDDYRFTSYPAAGRVLIDHRTGTFTLNLATLHPDSFLPRESPDYNARKRSALDATGRFLATTASKPNRLILWQAAGAGKP